MRKLKNLVVLVVLLACGLFSNAFAQCVGNSALGDYGQIDKATAESYLKIIYLDAWASSAPNRTVGTKTFGAVCGLEAQYPSKGLIKQEYDDSSIGQDGLTHLTHGVVYVQWKMANTCTGQQIVGCDGNCYARPTADQTFSINVCAVPDPATATSCPGGMNVPDKIYDTLFFEYNINSAATIAGLAAAPGQCGSYPNSATPQNIYCPLIYTPTGNLSCNATIGKIDGLSPPSNGGSSVPIGGSAGGSGGTTTSTCGGTGQPACPTTTCGGTGQPACTGGQTQCGGAGQPACTTSTCGGTGQPACDTGTGGTGGTGGADTGTGTGGTGGTSGGTSGTSGGTGGGTQTCGGPGQPACTVAIAGPSDLSPITGATATTAAQDIADAATSGTVDKISRWTANDPTAISKDGFATDWASFVTPVPSSGCQAFHATVGGFSWTFDHCATVSKVAEFISYAMWVWLVFYTLSLVLSRVPGE